jgi:phosphatidylserine/phosphatidylglycerophosphate/cardiolipin synthase-like enzyme
VINSILGVVARGGSVRVLLEPCPGANPNVCNDNTGPVLEAMRACDLLVAGGAAVKRANPGDATLPIPKTHAKSIVFDDGASLKAFILTPNLVPSSLSVRPGETVRRDYGVLTNDPGVIENLSRVFAQDWGADPPITACGDLTQWPRGGDGTSQIYDTLVVTPDVDAATGRSFARDKLLGLIQSATTSLKIQMEKIAPNRGPNCGNNDRDAEILPTLLAKAQPPAGVDVQILLTAPNHEPCNQNVFDDINLVAPGRARFQTQLSMTGGPIAGRPHAKMIIVDEQRVYLGSHNLTRQSFDERREIGWVNNDPGVVASFLQKFNADWAANQPAP